MIEEIKLDARLQKIADLIPSSHTIADIGTDHAHLPIHLLQTGKIKKAILTDKNKGPLLSAANNIREAELLDKVDFRKGDGLMPLVAGEAKTIVIAGMGGKLIQDILQNSIHIIEKADNLILQPMQAVKELRLFLYKHALYIARETLAKENSKIYNIILAKRGKKTMPDKMYFTIGINLEAEESILQEYLTKMQKKEAQIIRSLQKATPTLDIAQKLREREARLEDIHSYIASI